MKQHRQASNPDQLIDRISLISGLQGFIAAGFTVALLLPGYIYPAMGQTFTMQAFALQLLFVTVLLGLLLGLDSLRASAARQLLSGARQGSRASNVTPLDRARPPVSKVVNA